MFPSRYSCDRCRQQKVRCPKNWELPRAVGGGTSYLTPCERCTKADMPCVYSLRQRNKRSKTTEDTTSPQTTNPHTSQDLSSLPSNQDMPGYEFNDLIMTSLTTGMPGLDDNDAFSWTHGNSDITFTRDGDTRTQTSLDTSPTLSRDENKDGLTGQLMGLINRATSATRDLECATTIPLTVHSPVVNEAFEAANALVRIINSIPIATNSTYQASQPMNHDDNGNPPQTDFSAVFLALASHQYVLVLFCSICDSIKWSLGTAVQNGTVGSEPQQQTLHGAGSSSAQFIMVLQLVMHLLNRMSRSLQLGSQMEIPQQQGLAVGAADETEIGGSQGIVASAQGALRNLANEHGKLTETIQELQACIEDGVSI